MENSTSDKKRNKGSKILMGLVIVAVILFAIGFSYYKTSLKAVSQNNSEVIELELPAGTSTNGIANILHENNLIKDKLIFKVRVKLLDKVGKLKAGNYELSKGMTMDQIIESLAQGGKSGDTLKFTIPEGYEIYLIGEKLEKEGLINKDRFMDLSSDKKNFEEEFNFLKELDEGQSLEGFLFPSTYEVFKDADEEDIISKMLEEFELVYKETIRDKVEDLGLSLNEVITMASLVEREARTDGERGLIAGVYYNRIKIGMKLQCDATVQYALGERKERLLYKDLEINSPYNTYLHYGLPIGPISSVGIPSIEAALEPEESDYLYYVAKPDLSGHVFSKTLDDHNKAKKEYLKSLN